MKHVDYAKIAPRYDKQRRKYGKPDQILEAFFAERDQDQHAIIDVGCGTGIYLQAQVAHFADRDIHWIGLEPSQEMLNIAIPKVPGASFVKGPAEALPFRNDIFDCLLTSFAFHHFIDKPRALDEFARVIRTGGTLRYANVTPEKMPGWVYYRFFPSTRTNDLERFWTADRLESEIADRGFDVTLNIEYRRTPKTSVDVLEEFRNRDASQLWTISDAEYREGFEKAEKELGNPTDPFEDEMAIITVNATKN